MKRVEVIVRRSALEAVKAAAHSTGCKTMTISEIYNVGDETREITYRGVTDISDALPRKRVEMIVAEDAVELLLQQLGAIEDAGDGWIAVSDVDRLVRLNAGRPTFGPGADRHSKPVIGAPLSTSPFANTPVYQQSR